MRKKIVAGNWKMNGLKKQALSLAETLVMELAKLEAEVDCIVFPPAVYLDVLQPLLQASRIALGAQNTYPAEFGAYTGEIATAMLAELGCTYVLVGHSERRQLFSEDENFVAKKFHHVKEHGMIPVLCVGETLKEREAGLTKAVVERQLAAVAKGKESFCRAIIAYEPIWAIGTGINATPAEAQEVQEFIRAEIRKENSLVAEKLPILYGGSVTEANARALFAMPDVDGGLVGGASLSPQRFVEIVKCIN